MNDSKVITGDLDQKRMTYFKVIHFVGIVVFLIYIMKFNFQYRENKYNFVLFLCFTIFALVPPVILKITKKYVPAALILGTIGTFLISYMLYASGGTAAPGIFWLAAIPLSLGVLLGLPGAYLGYAIVIMSFSYFQYLSANHLGPNIVAAKGDYAYEKIFNLVIFLLFSSFTTHQYIKGEQLWARRMVDKNTDIDNLLRLLLHDIANSLSSMTYNVLKARKSQQNENLTHELDRIEKSVNDINNLLIQVRHLKSVKDGKVSLPLRPLLLSGLLNEVLEKISETAQQKDIEVQLDVSCETMLIAGDRNLLSNVILMNLLTNAVKFSPPGGIILLKAYCSGPDAVIEVEDHGIGIPEPILRQIFDLNARTSRLGTNGEKGTGYGMPLVKEYLDMMNGTIEVYSQEQKTPDAPHGTRVKLTFEQSCRNVSCD